MPRPHQRTGRARSEAERLTDLYGCLSSERAAASKLEERAAARQSRLDRYRADDDALNGDARKGRRQ